MIEKLQMDPQKRKRIEKMLIYFTTSLMRKDKEELKMLIYFTTSQMSNDVK